MLTLVEVNKMKVIITCHYNNLRFLYFFQVSSPAGAAVPMSQAYQDGSPVPVYGKYSEEARDYL